MAARAALLLLLGLLGLSAPALAQFGVMHENNTGWFYFYASGQVVVANPYSGRVFYTLRSSDAISHPFPNRCPGSSFRGEWADVTYGPGKRSLLASMVYEAPVAQRSHGFKDGILHADVRSATVDTFTPTDAPPDTATFVPVMGKVFLTSSGKGADTQTLGLMGTQAGAALEKRVKLPAQGALASYAKDGSRVAAGQFLHHFNLGRKAYLTSPVAPGVFSLDLFHKNMVPSASYDYNMDFISFADLGCPATGSAVYSRLLRMAFFACADLPTSAVSNKIAAAPARKGVVQLDTLSNTPIGVLPLMADKVFVTPDESFLLVLNKAQKTIHMYQFNSSSRSLVKWNDLTWPTGYTPVDIAFAAKAPYYQVIISYLDIDRIGIIDFQRVLQCGLLCTVDNSAAFVQDQQQMGFQNTPGPDGAVQGALEPHFVPQSTRAIATGGGFVCQSAVYEQAVYCFNPQVGAPIKFQNISFAQHIRYVPGPLTNYTDKLQRINPTFDCDNADLAPAPAAAGGGEQGASNPWDENSAPAGLVPSFQFLVTLCMTMYVIALIQFK